MKQWRVISLAGILFGNAALLLDYFIIPVSPIIMIPLLLISITMIFTGLAMRKKSQKD